jgi:hypothetical protein
MTDPEFFEWGATGLDVLYFEEMMVNQEYRQGAALYKALAGLIETIESSPKWDLEAPQARAVILEMALLGDPELWVINQPPTLPVLSPQQPERGSRGEAAEGTESGTVVYVDPQLVRAKSGDCFTVDLSVSEVEGLAGYWLKLSWDPAVVRFVSVEEGPFLRSAGWTYFWKSTGQGSFEIFCMVWGSGSASGSGVLASVSFEAVARGETVLDLHDVKLYDGSWSIIQCTEEDGQVRVR